MILIGIKSYSTLKTYCRHLGYQGHMYCEEEIEQLFLLSRWLKAGYGSHSRAQFCQLRSQDQLRQAFHELDINIDKEVLKLHHKIEEAYEQGNYQAC